MSCKENGKPHKFILIDGGSWDTGIREVCQVCKKIETYSLINDELDTERYLENHKADFLQKHDLFFDWNKWIRGELA